VNLALLAFGLIGYLVAVPVLVWHRRDLRSFHRPLWAGYGSRRARLRGAVVCYLALGWPELLMALGWRTSLTRGALVVERESSREARSLHFGGNGAP
jgi:hypothetical protein